MLGLGACGCVSSTKTLVDALCGLLGDEAARSFALSALPATKTISGVRFRRLGDETAWSFALSAFLTNRRQPASNIAKPSRTRATTHNAAASYRMARRWAWNLEPQILKPGRTAGASNRKGQETAQAQTRNAACIMPR